MKDIVHYAKGVTQAEVKARWGFVIDIYRHPGCAAMRRPWALELNTFGVLVLAHAGFEQANDMLKLFEGVQLGGLLRRESAVAIVIEQVV